jgi:enoyl-[acyl-carrier protein] reductase I
MTASAATLAGRRVLVTGIADASSLALPIARELAASGAEIVCTGVGPTPHHGELSPAAARYLRDARDAFASTVRDQLGSDVPALVADVALDASLDDLAAALQARGLALDGVVHAVAMDRSIRGGSARPLLEVTREEFLDCMSVSAWSLVALVRALLRGGVLRPGASVVALSYLGAERVMAHPYRNIGIAKAALERIVRELAAELGPLCGARINAVRFSPWSRSRAGGAIPGLDDAVADAALRAPLGNADPLSLAREVAHLLRPELAVTGEVRHVDGGYHVRG